MNWMNGLCLLIGLAFGGEIMFCIMKYRYDSVAEKIDKLHIDLVDALSNNSRILNGWHRAVDLNDELIDLLKNANERKQDEDEDNA